MPRQGLKKRITGFLEMTEEAARRARSRDADATFLLGRRFLRDRLFSDLYFLIRTNEWQRCSESADHMSGFATGINRCARPTRVLDLCTGTGHTAAALARGFSDAKVVAVDGSRRMLRRARQLHDLPNLELVRSDVIALPFADATFDLVVIQNGICWPPEVHRIAAARAELLLAKSFVQPSPDSSAWVAIWREHGFERRQAETIGEGGFEIFERMS